MTITIVTSTVDRTQSICVLFSPPVVCHHSQVTNMSNSIQE